MHPPPSEEQRASTELCTRSSGLLETEYFAKEIFALPVAASLGIQSLGLSMLNHIQAV